jgi:hypothetical protein
MPSAAYFRRQADICLRLSLIASDEVVSSKLITMARDYMATSEALEREAGTCGPVLADRSQEPPDVAPDQTALGVDGP